MNFDALDFFQNQKSQERSALHCLEEARTTLEDSRTKLEGVESVLLEKKKNAGDLRRKLLVYLSPTTLKEQVTLLEDRVNLVLTVEEKCSQNVLKISEKISEEYTEQEEPTKIMLDSLFKQISIQYQDFFIKNEEEKMKIQEKHENTKNESKTWKESLKKIEEETKHKKEMEMEREEKNFQLLQQIETIKMKKESNIKEKLDMIHEKLLKEKENLVNLENERILKDKQALMSFLSAMNEFSNEMEENEKLKEKMNFEKANVLNNLKKVENTILISLQNQLHEQKENLSTLRSTLKPVELLWEEQRSEEEKVFHRLVQQKIQPKREENILLKKNIKEIQEKNNEFRKLMIV